MSKVLHNRSVVFAAAVGFSVLVLWWVVHGEFSPFRGYFLYHVGVSNFLALINLPAIVVAILVSGNAHGPNEIVCFILMFVQWFTIGWLVFGSISWVRSKLSRNAS